MGSFNTQSPPHYITYRFLIHSNRASAFKLIVCTIYNDVLIAFIVKGSKIKKKN